MIKVAQTIKAAGIDMEDYSQYATWISVVPVPVDQQDDVRDWIDVGNHHAYAQALFVPGFDELLLAVRPDRLSFVVRDLGVKN